MIRCLPAEDRRLNDIGAVRTRGHAEGFVEPARRIIDGHFKLDPAAVPRLRDAVDMGHQRLAGLLAPGPVIDEKTIEKKARAAPKSGIDGKVRGQARRPIADLRQNRLVPRIGPEAIAQNIVKRGGEVFRLAEIVGEAANHAKDKRGIRRAG